MSNKPDKKAKTPWWAKLLYFVVIVSMFLIFSVVRGGFPWVKDYLGDVPDYILIFGVLLIMPLFLVVLGLLNSFGRIDDNLLIVPMDRINRPINLFDGTAIFILATALIVILFWIL